MEYKLTQYTDAGGCGCKISPIILERILSYSRGLLHNKEILVGNNNNDDAAVYQISESQGIVSTVDFFTPVVNEPFTFGQIAAANAISDVYAMGGKPLWALAILGYPIDVLDHSVGTQIIEGANSICEKAGISIIGGHSINNPQPIFGLSVNGIIDIKNIKQNKNAQVNDCIFLTKPIGVGILSTALKLDRIEMRHYNSAVENMIALNTIGMELANLNYVNAMTDITGFGLLGHLGEICKSSQVSAIIDFNKVIIIEGVERYVKDNIVTGGGKRNWESYKNEVKGGDTLSKVILSDPQTNGGLLITVSEQFINDFQKILIKNNLQNHIEPIGRIISKGNYQIEIIL